MGMKRLLLTIFTIILASCAAPTQKDKVKEKPAYAGMISDPEVYSITKSYFELSTYNHITFRRYVTMGFTDIERGNVIGLCTFGRGFREIDLDKTYWKNATWPSKVALVYHELTHCYCQRDHDFDNGTMYPDGSLRYILQRWQDRLPSPLKPEGFLGDGCPKSIMHPIILDNECFEKHYDYYTTEMFARCKPF